MTKHLRLIMLSLLAMIFLGGYAQSETVFRTLSFPDENQSKNGLQNYTDTWYAKIGSDTWVIDKFNNNRWANNWKYIKCGSKKAATIASIATENAFNAPISKVVVSYGKVSATDKLNKFYLQIASDAAFTKDKVTIDGKLENSGAFDYTFTIPTPVKGRYFKLVYDIQQTGDNGTIQVDKVEYWQKAESGKTATTLSFKDLVGKGVTLINGKLTNGNDFNGYTATVTPVEATGSIVYESSDAAIAKVDAQTGAITLGAKYGTAKITARFDATGSFANSEASYSIKHVGDFVFYESFDKCDGTGGNDDEYSGNIASKTCTDEKLDESWTRDGRVFAANKCLRVGKDGTATTRLINITGKAVLLFKTAAWEGDNSNINLSINGGTLNYDGTASESIVLTPTEAKWEDFEIEITSTKPFTLSFQSDKRFFLDDVIVIAKEITLDENGDNMVEAAKNVNVTLKRTLYGDGGWNTLCVPFSLTAAQVTAAFGNDVELRKLSSIEGTTLKFVSTDIITAGEPCLIKVAKDGSTYNFEGVATIAVASNKDYTFSMVRGDIQFLGIYSPMDVVTVNPAGPSTGYYAFLGEGNKFFKAQAETKMKGFRAFFLVPNNVPSNALKAVIDGTATGIEDLVIDGVKANGRVYNLNGQYVGNSLNGLQPGLYIQNGKKIVVK